MISPESTGVQGVPRAAPWDDDRPVIVPTPRRAGRRQMGNPNAWASIWLGIMVAGGAYPLAAAAIMIFVGAIHSVWTMWTRIGVSYGPSEMVLFTLGMGVVTVSYAVFAACYAGMVAVITLPIFYLFVRSLKLRARNAWLGAIAGGLVGFLATFPMLVFAAVFAGGGGSLWDNDFGSIAAVLAMGPALTTVLGQIGGAWGGRRADRQAPGSPHWAEVRTVDGEWRPMSAEGGSDDLAERAPLFQFRIHHLLWISVWASLLLTAIRLSGAPFELILPLFLGWLAFQTLTLYAGGWLARRSNLS